LKADAIDEADGIDEVDDVLVVDPNVFQSLLWGCDT